MSEGCRRQGRAGKRAQGAPVGVPLSRRAFLLALGGGLAAWSGCRRTDPAAPPAPPSTVLTPGEAAGRPQVTAWPMRFTDVSTLAGLTWRFSNGSSAPATLRHPFIEQTGGGVALFDYDNDGRLDIFAVQGGPPPGDLPDARRWNTENVLYRNNGDGTFTDVTAAAGLSAPTGYGQGVSVADYDNDGWPDLYVTAYGGNHLYHNNGDGTFTDVTAAAGVGDRTLPGLPDERSWATSAAWGDYDNDGSLDLFVCHYCRWSPAQDSLTPKGTFPAPMLCPPSHCRLYHNNGDGTFTDVTQRSGLAELWGKSLSAVWIDYDDDGWMDLFVTNDTMPDFLLHNNRDGTFTDRAVAAGVAYNAMGHATASMGIGVFDYRREGREDLFVANYAGELKTVRHNLGGGLFEDAARATRIPDTNEHYLGFGVECFDYDLDGWPDVIVGNGHVSADVAGASVDGETYAQSQQLLHNQGDGTFREDERSLGDLVLPRVTRGLAVGDYDNDGDLDVLMVSQAGPLQLYRNDGGNRNHWITFRLEGVHSNRDAVGAKVTVRTRRGKQTQWVRGGSSYCSHSDLRLTFGLGREDKILSLDVRWPRGLRQHFGPLRSGRFYWLREASTPQPDARVRPPDPSEAALRLPAHAGIQREMKSAAKKT